MTATPGGRVSVKRYLTRVGYDGPLAPADDVLRALHLAHATHVPFENIDVLLGRGIDLAPAALERKLVAGGRGGYCFEQNLLFADVLEQLGFEVTMLSGRVRLGAAPGTVRPRTHMVLLVQGADGATRWIADVGFGSYGLLQPVPLEPGMVSSQFRWTYRVAPEEGWWVMQAGRDTGWTDLYAFTLDRCERIDYEVLNHFTATHPHSIFRSTLLAQRPLPDRRIVLRNRELTIDTGAAVTTRVLAAGDVRAELRETFGIDLPPDVALPELP